MRYYLSVVRSCYGDVIVFPIVVIVGSVTDAIIAIVVLLLLCLVTVKVLLSLFIHSSFLLLLVFHMQYVSELNKQTIKPFLRTDVATSE